MVQAGTCKMLVPDYIENCLKVELQEIEKWTYCIERYE